MIFIILIFSSHLLFIPIFFPFLWHRFFVYLLFRFVFRLINKRERINSNNKHRNLHTKNEENFNNAELQFPFDARSMCDKEQMEIYVTSGPQWQGRAGPSLHFPLAVLFLMNFARTHNSRFRCALSMLLFFLYCFVYHYS